jgi:hypothetical protein
MYKTVNLEEYKHKKWHIQKEKTILRFMEINHTF